MKLLRDPENPERLYPVDDCAFCGRESFAGMVQPYGDGKFFLTCEECTEFQGWLFIESGWTSEFRNVPPALVSNGLGPRFRMMT